MSATTPFLEKNPLQKSRGAVRNLTSVFLKYKHREQFDSRDRQADRFKAKSNFLQGFAMNTMALSNGAGYSGINSPSENSTDKDNFLPLSTKVSSNESSIEYSKRFLPPEWVDTQEEIERHLEEITHKIRKNIQIALAHKLKEITFDIRKLEKEHFLKVQEIHGEESFMNKKEKEEFLENEGELALDQDDGDLSYSVQKTRSKEITNLVSNINDLAVLFKDLQTLVVEQGTILDRIDYNVETAKKDVKQGLVHLEKTKNIEKSGRAKSVILCLLVSIIICIVLMVIKHT